MNGGQLVKVAKPAQIFANPQWLKDNHLTVPKTTQMAHELERGGFTFNPYPLTLEQLAVQIKRQLESRTQ
jgi:energy-coupling factor transport system ATP-binding protein